MTPTDTRFSVLADQAMSLVRTEATAQVQREQLSAAIRQAVNGMGASIDEVSAVTGLTTDEITRILARPTPLDDLAVLAGC